MCDPWDTFKVNSLFDHFIKRTHVSELFNFGYDKLKGWIDILHCIESADPEPNWCMRQLNIDAHRTENEKQQQQM